MSIGFIFSRFLYWLHQQTQTSKGAEPAIRNVFVLRTHVYNSYVQRTFVKMQQQLGADCVFLLFDATKQNPTAPAVHWNDSGGIAKGPMIITINEADCQQINTLHTAGPEAGSMHRVEAHVYACYKAIRLTFDYLWFIEYDVYCQDYNAVVHTCNGIAADLLTSGNRKNRLLTVSKKPKWHWWPSLFGEIAQTPMSQRVGCFFPINRFSTRFLKVIEQNLSKSSGYCEVYFPTLCRLNGLKVGLIPRWLFGIYRYQPNIPEATIRQINKKDFRLFHPVKNLPE